MLNHKGLIAIIVGAPGCGKTTLSPFISTIISVSEGNQLDVEHTAKIIDEFLNKYLTSHPYNSLSVLHDLLLNEGLTLPKNFFLDASKVAETADLPNYHNERGEVNRSLTPLANAYCFSRVLLQQANVIITGTGIAMYRFLPLLNLDPQRPVKVIRPDKEQKGYFHGAMTNAPIVRTGEGGINHKRLVPTVTLNELYALQDNLLAESGCWSKISQLETFSSLALTILTYSHDQPQQEIALIKHYLNTFIDLNAF